VKARITLREGLGQPEAAEVLASTPSTAPDQWLTREAVADTLEIDIRTVDRYLRQQVLSKYEGPVPGRLHGVRVWAADVEHLRPETVTEVQR
jgi:uncharacterized protein (DUF2342 family)